MRICKDYYVQLHLSISINFMTLGGVGANSSPSLDREIDALVYELYGLTEEEIRIVEGGEG